MENQKIKDTLELNQKRLVKYINKAVDDFEEKKINFSEYKTILIGSATELGRYINFKYNLYKLIDAWLELIEFCYLESDWYQYGLEVGNFLLEGLESFPEEIKLPQESIVVKEQLQSFNDGL